ncbi:MAG: hypothetical protein J6G98_01745 [Bacilli bacterium]|nr:hypothetical protein [Bacilli bacterium]
MIKKILLFLFGYSLTLIGLIYVISYLNILALGYNFLFYVKFIFRRIECLYTLIGLILIILSIYLPGGENELYL